MVYSKKEIKIVNALVFVFIILASMGQLIRIPINLGDSSFTLHPIDLISLSFAIVFMCKRGWQWTTWRLFTPTIAALAFSLVMSLTVFAPLQVTYGGLYLLRLVSYFAMFVVIQHLVKSKKINDLILKSVVISSLFVGLLGFVQYIIVYDTRTIGVWGWDYHLGRLISTHLDPNFSGLILTLGIVISTGLYFKERSRYVLLSMVTLLPAFALTYSRSSYLSLIFAFATLTFLLRKNVIKFVAVALMIIAMIFIVLPKGDSIGVKLDRKDSIYMRFDNFNETSQIWHKYPLFGVGYNNICTSRTEMGYKSGLHSCGGADNSIMFILATSGVVGLMMFVFMGSEMINLSRKDIYGFIFLSCLVAVFVHSMFINSAFYPWILGYMALIGAVGVKEYTSR